MKKVLIISPHFPPVNAPDMHRVRHLLGALGEHGWQAEVIAVHPDDVEGAVIDPLLLQTVPADVHVHKIRALSVSWTRKLGIGSLSLRSFLQYRKKGDQLLRSGRFDVVYFSTTAFHLMALGPYWKRKFSIPYILDFQDPWRNDYYLSQPKSKRPPKFWLNYRLDKWLEKRTVPQAAALISVSPVYLEQFRERYGMEHVPQVVIPFGIHLQDMPIASAVRPNITLRQSDINIVYVGRGGKDMQTAAHIFFSALQKVAGDRLSQIKCWFVGTDYAATQFARKTFEPIAAEHYPSISVQEITGRIPYYEGLSLLNMANGLLIPGSDDVGYTPSKIFPYLLTGKPVLAIMREESPAVGIFSKYSMHPLIKFRQGGWDADQAVDGMTEFLGRVFNPLATNAANQGLVEFLRSLVTSQIDLLNDVTSHNIKPEKQYA